MSWMWIPHRAYPRHRHSTRLGHLQKKISCQTGATRYHIIQVAQHRVVAGDCLKRQPSKPPLAYGAVSNFRVNCVNVSSTRPETLPVWAWI